jgi:YjbE family integral membrane protein
LAPEWLCGKVKNMNIASPLTALFQVLVIDLSLAADNAVVIGMAAAGLSLAQRRRAIWLGLLAATALRIGLAFFAVRLLHIAGLTFAGGVLLLWVAWKMARDLRRAPSVRPARSEERKNAGKKLSTAIVKILLADLGMSLDNILAVAGAARDHYVVLAFGLVLSVGLTGLAATATAKILHRFPWIGWLGVAVVVYVAVDMIAVGSKIFLS